MTAVQRLEMLLTGFLLGSREQVKINAFGNEGRPNQSTAGNVLLGKIFLPETTAKRNAAANSNRFFPKGQNHISIGNTFQMYHCKCNYCEGIEGLAKVRK